MKNIDWQSIECLLGRPWFYRLWVIQEVSQARRAIVVCGQSKISWTVLATSLAYIVQNDLTNHLDPVCIFPCNNVIGIQQIRRRYYKDPLFTIALENTHGSCRDPKDKIFALMSISGGCDMFDWETSFDYDLSVEELYKRFAIWDIVRNRTLRILTCVTPPSEYSDQPTILPSWVPDWTRTLDRQLLVRVNATSKVSAGSRKDGEVWFSREKTIMYAEGIIINSIGVTGSETYSLKITSIFEIDSASVNELQATKEWLLEYWNVAKDSHLMTRKTYDAFWRTMLCDMDDKGLPAPKRYSEYFLEYFKSMREAPDMLKTILENPAPVVPFAIKGSYRLVKLATSIGLTSESSLSHSWRLNMWFDEYLRSSTLIENLLHKWGKSKRFCRTRDGRLARVPTHAAMGDVICILHWSEVPHVIRSQGDGTYTVIGECYVHGVMHGEALELPSYRPEILRLH
ncbi:hypothetical protein CC86DRAFT_399978 [Ophiobolus disseminans]|uniref:Heterokaryon incompatibility domain-containing protein n=1 Tax=Ophiobolus disseminans TaxID=1469910 RepID=A0A6A7AJ84_9PLEO|nr:hypothetical protein CC86DRAFT_399978 [Ophiobolus disseminans]